MHLNQNGKRSSDRALTSRYAVHDSSGGEAAPTPSGGIRGTWEASCPPECFFSGNLNVSVGDRTGGTGGGRTRMPGCNGSDRGSKFALT